MTHIAINPQQLARTARIIREVGHEYLAIVRELDILTQDFPEMPAEYRYRIRDALGSVMEELARLVLAHDPDVAAMEMAVRIIERDAGKVWREGAGGLLSVLNASYAMVDDVYNTALKYGMSLEEAADHLGGASHITDEFVRVLGIEGTVAPGIMKGLASVGGIGVDFIEEYGASEGSLWLATQRTLVSSGTAAVVAAALARGCNKLVKMPIVKGGCMVAGGMLGDSIGDRINEKIFGAKTLTPEDRERIRAASYPSGLTPEQEAERLQDAREGFEEARSALIDELMEQGESREDAERIADINFPDYLLVGQ